MSTIVAFNNARSNASATRAAQAILGLATQHDVIVVREPIEGCDSGDRHPTPSPHGRITLLQSFDAETVEALVAERDEEAPVAWFIGAGEAPMPQAWQPRATVYDRLACVDMRDLPQDRALLDRADLVITAVPGHMQQTRLVHANVACIPDGVDTAFFSPFHAMKSPELIARAAGLHAGLNHPRLAYHGDIDASLDHELILWLAQAHPGWEIVLAGEVKGVAVDRLRSTSNISLLGPVPPAMLPHMIAQCSVAILPYAQDDKAHLVNPSAALGYLSYGRAVVSTANTPAAALYGDGIDVAADAGAFARLCQARAFERPPQRQARVSAARSVVQRHGWAQATESMCRALDAILGERRRDAAVPHAARTPVAVA